MVLGGSAHERIGVSWLIGADGAVWIVLTHAHIHTYTHKHVHNKCTCLEEVVQVVGEHLEDEALVAAVHEVVLQPHEVVLVPGVLRLRSIG